METVGKSSRIDGTIDDAEPGLRRRNPSFELTDNESGTNEEAEKIHSARFFSTTCTRTVALFCGCNRQEVLYCLEPEL
jgi:hypothetical protein